LELGQLEEHFNVRCGVRHRTVSPKRLEAVECLSLYESQENRFAFSSSRVTT
jgi:hypothetical protein